MALIHTGLQSTKAEEFLSRVASSTPHDYAFHQQMDLPTGGPFFIFVLARGGLLIVCLATCV